MRSAIILGIVLLFMAMTIALSRAADHAVDAYAIAQAQPPSAVDTILQSRQTPPRVADSHTGGAGMLALGLVLAAAVVLTLRSGGDFLRQWRLLQRGRRKRPSPPPSISTPAPIPPVSSAPPAPPVPALPQPPAPWEQP